MLSKPARPGSVFRRLETDVEFHVRIRERVKLYWFHDTRGQVLDEIAWDYLKMQRRIVEDATRA